MNYKLKNTETQLYLIGFRVNSEPVNYSAFKTFDAAMQQFANDLRMAGFKLSMPVKVYAAHNMHAFHPYELITEVEHGADWPIKLGLVEKVKTCEGDKKVVSFRFGRVAVKTEGYTTITSPEIPPIPEAAQDVEKTCGQSVNPFPSDVLRTAGFLAMGVASLESEDFNQMGQLELVHIITEYAPFINDVGAWLCANDLLACVYDYDVTESFGRKAAELIIDEIAVIPEKVLIEIFEELTERNVYPKWRECPFLQDYLKTVAVTPEENKNSDVWKMQIPVLAYEHLPLTYVEDCNTAGFERAEYTFGAFIQFTAADGDDMSREMYSLYRYVEDNYSEPDRSTWVRFDAVGDHVEGLPVYELTKGHAVS